MKFTLSDPTVEIPEPVFREVGSTITAHLMLMLLAEQNAAQYRRIASELRQETSPKITGGLTYDCVHPEWFDGEEGLQVDSTTCSFCAYNHTCTMGEDNSAYVEIVPLLGARIPSRSVMKELFYFEGTQSAKLPYDPFLGFSHKAGQTRKIYLLKHSNFIEKFPDLSYCKMFHHHAIGYDRSTGQSLWTIDNEFLSNYEKLNKSKQLVFEDFSVPESHNLTVLDRELIIECSLQNNWFVETDGLEEQDILLRFFSGVKDFLMKNKAFKSLSNYGHKSSTPLVDHPHRRSTSNWMNMALRWMELKPLDFVKLLQPLGDTLLLNRIIYPNISLKKDTTTYVPRFPVIALIPKNLSSCLRLEHAAFRVIDVVEYSGKSVMLLIDSLGIDLRGEL